MSVKLEVGKSYKIRGGNRNMAYDFPVVTIVSVVDDPEEAGYNYIGDDNYSYREDGVFSDEKETEWDLIEEV